MDKGIAAFPISAKVKFLEKIFEMIEQWFLKSAAIQEKIIQNSGLTLEQLIAWDKEQSEKAIARLADLFLPNLWIASHPNVIELERGFACRTYKVINSQGIGFSKTPNSLTVFCSIGIKADNKLWYHISVSNKNKIPSYSELILIKNIFIGEDNTAIQVIPASRYHVNDHPNCLHLWRCLEGDVLPEFSAFGTI